LIKLISNLIESKLYLVFPIRGKQSRKTTRLPTTNLWTVKHDEHWLIYHPFY